MHDLKDAAPSRVSQSCTVCSPPHPDTTLGQKKEARGLQKPPAPRELPGWMSEGCETSGTLASENSGINLVSLWVLRGLQERCQCHSQCLSTMTKGSVNRFLESRALASLSSPRSRALASGRPWALWGPQTPDLEKQTPAHTILAPCCERGSAKQN